MAVDNGAVRQEPERKPLQLKRATAKAFIKANPVLLKGEPAFEYDMQRLKIGDGYTRYRDLPYIADARKIPKDGKSAYDLWLDEGHEGTVEDFLDSLIGKSAYEIWLDLGFEGSESDFIKYLTTTTWGTF